MKAFRGYAPIVESASGIMVSPSGYPLTGTMLVVMASPPLQIPSKPEK